MTAIVSKPASSPAWAISAMSGPRRSAATGHEKSLMCKPSFTESLRHVRSERGFEDHRPDDRRQHDEVDHAQRCQPAVERGQTRIVWRGGRQRIDRFPGTADREGPEKE